MYTPDTHPHLAIDKLPNDLDFRKRLKAAEKISYFMVGIQDYYEHDLNLKRIDTDPRPGTHDELYLRLGYLERAKQNNHEYFLAQRLAPDGTISESVGAIRGLLIVTRLQPSQQPREHIQITEFDVAAGERGSGLGGALLRHAMTEVPSGSLVRLDVAEANEHAHAVYAHYGFEQSGEPEYHGVFDVAHIPMSVEADVFKERLGVK